MRFTFLLCSLAFLCVTSAFSRNFAGTISGPSTVCLPGSGSQYTVSGSSANTGYSWSVQGGTITSGSGTKTITVTFTSTGLGQNITVSGNGLSAQYAVSVYAPITNAGTISGPSVICPGAQGIAFSVGGVATSVYSWGMPSGATIASGSGTSSITVNFSSSYPGGNISVAGVNGPCGTGPYASKSVSNNVAVPGSPGAISGSTSVLQGQNGVPYTVPSITNATGYTWLLPSGASIASGANTNSITVNFSGSFIGGGIQVRGTSGACDGPASAPLNIILNTLPVAAGSISGNYSPCIGPSGSSFTYSVPAITNATYYSWTLPPYCYIQGNGSSNSVTVFFPIQVGSTGTISVQGMNGQGGGPSSSIGLSFFRPAPALGSISGQPIVCPGQSNVVYSVTSTPNVNPYVWVIPSGASIVSGSGTNTITVNYSGGFTSGNINVFGVGGSCGAGPSSTIAVASVTPPPTPTMILGSPLVCPSESNVNYSVALVSGATSYVWSTPSGSSIVSGQGSNSISVNYSTSVMGGISVYATNCSGNSVPVTLPISVRTTPSNAGLIYGRAEVCPGESSVYYSTNSILGATGYTWTVPSGATIVSGLNTNEIEVNYSSNATSGNITVAGTNCTVSGSSSQLAISLVGKIAAPNIEHSVNLVTGTVSAGLPLLTVSDGDIQIPVHLNYTGSGIKVKNSDGWLSHNWNVNAQSFGIFRDMRGLPDDYSGISPDNRRGWLNGTMPNTVKNFTPTSDNNPATCADEVANYTFLDGINYDQDTEPDAFHVSLPGLSFDFYFDETKSPQVVPYSEVIITPNTTSGTISSFTIKDTNGVEYLFNETETLTEKVQAASQFYFVRKTNQQVTQFTYNTAWRLTKITSPIYGEINLTYDTQNINNDDLKPNVTTGSKYYSYFYNFPEVIANTHGASNTTSYHRSSVQKLLRKITTPNQDVEFLSVDKYPGSLTKRLNSIHISEKRSGSPVLTNEINFTYNLYYSRIFLSILSFKSYCNEATYKFLYNDYSLPGYNSADVDEWGYYKVKNQVPGSLQYDESASATSLSKIIHPLNGFTAFFYETNDYWDGTTNKQGGGIRIKKIIEHDGISSLSDRVSEYDYKSVNGNSSGILHHKAALGFSVARQSTLYYGPTSPRYRQVQVAYPTSDVNAMFTISGDRDLASPNFVMGSPVAYERVTVKIGDAGKNVYEYKFWTPHGTISTTNGEWSASKVLIARPSTGNSYCFETPNIQEGYYRYPFPVNPNYSFANVELTKTSSYNQAGVLVKDVVYTYKRVYKGTAVRTIYGLTLEELPTYYFNGSAYVDAKMFLYSKYSILTAVKTELGSSTETIYHTPDQLVKNESAIEYFYSSSNHRELSKTVMKNSDGSESIEEFKYTKDYVFSSPVGEAAVAIVNLQNSNRIKLVELIKSRNRGGTISPLSANLTTFKTLSGKVFPDKEYSFVSVNGNSSFNPASASGSSFNYDQLNYVLFNTNLSYDNFGNLTETMSRDRSVSSVAFGYNGTLPMINISNAKLDEVRFSNFETPTIVDFTLSSPASYTTGRSGIKALNLPAGNISANTLSHTFTNRKASVYVFSVWIKTPTAGTINIYVGGSSSGTIPLSFSASSGWKFYTINIPVGSMVGSSNFDLKVWSTVATKIDDVAFHPLQSGFKAFSYYLPYGKNSETDASGNTAFYEYDRSGRVSVIYDRDHNLIKTFTYHVKQ